MKRTGVFDRLYLAGGTAIAVHLHHRRSIDLDLFSLTPELDLESLADQLRKEGATTIALGDATLSLRIGNVPIDIVRYPYAPVTAFERGPEDVRLASLRELAAMKLSAIARRGIRRDFWDLYAIIESGAVTLARALDDYTTKFGVARSDVYHVLRALLWFEEAEQDVMPRGMTTKHWQQIRAWYERVAALELVRRAQTRPRSLKKHR